MLTEMLASALVMYSKLTIFIFHVMLQTVLVAGGREGGLFGTKRGYLCPRVFC